VLIDFWRICLRTPSNRVNGTDVRIKVSHQVDLWGRANFCRAEFATGLTEATYAGGSNFLPLITPCTRCLRGVPLNRNWQLFENEALTLARTMLKKIHQRSLQNS